MKWKERSSRRSKIGAQGGRTREVSILRGMLDFLVGCDVRMYRALLYLQREDPNTGS